MTQLEIGQLTAAGVCGERGQPVPVDVFEAELRAGVGSLAPDDDSHVLGPLLQVQQAGELGDVGAVPGLLIRVAGGVQTSSGISF